LAWDGERVMHMRDFRYARYATECAKLSAEALKGQQCCPGRIASTASLPDKIASLARV
jgi:hypothetical protein